MKKLLIVLGVILVTAVWIAGSSLFSNSAGISAFAEPEHWGHHHCGHHHFWKKLNLTDDQKKEMFAIRLDEQAKIKPLVQKLKDGRQQLTDVVKSGKFDEAKVQSIAKGRADIISQIIVEKTRMKSRMYAVLTPDQHAKAEQMHEKWKARQEKEEENKD
jgi:Spy/CpxP family protein refolding chaperone